MAKIRIEKEKRADWDIVRYSGPMNEESGIHLLPLYDSVGSRCVFNFKELTSINSKGISAWMNFARTFREGRQLAFEECPDCLVMQINMIPSFAMHVDVRSVFAPYVCTSCGARTLRLIELKRAGRTVEGADLAPRGTCDKCRSALEPEEDPSEYFLFLERSTPGR